MEAKSQKSPLSSSAAPAAAPDSPATSRQPLTICQRVLFGAAAPPWQLSQNAIGLYLNLFLLEVVKLRPLLVSVVLFSGRLLDAFSDPLIGYGVSRSRTRFGQCRPWLAAAAPVSALAFLGLWLPPAAGGDWGLAYYLPVYMAFSVAISCYYIPYTTLTVRISPKPSERDSATAYRMAFEMLGILASPLVFAFIVEPRRSSVGCVAAAAVSLNLTTGADGGVLDSTGVDGGVTNDTRDGHGRSSSSDAEKSAYLIAASAVSCLILLCGIAGFCGIREVDDADASGDRNGGAGKQTMRGYLSQCKQVVTYGPFVQATTAFVTLSLSWHASAISCLFAGLLPAGSLVLLYILVVLAGVLGANALLLTWAMLPDVIQAFYRDRGCRMEAAFYSTFTFLNKCIVSVALAGLNLVLELASYDRFACAQPRSLVTALRGLMLAPLPLLCLAVFCAYRLPAGRPEDGGVTVTVLSAASATTTSGGPDAAAIALKADVDGFRVV